ncbi:MAG: SdpI family protein [Clostridia bacterium]|nr:SdpI family protein [Clostridia bacterium]
MLKKNKGLMILTSVVILLPMAAGVLLWEQLPQRMAIHWGMNGEADGWGSRPVVVFGMPLLLLAIHWLGVWITGQDKRNRHQNEKVLQLMFWIAPVIAVFGMGSTYASALGQSVPVDRLVLLLLGIVFAVIGNYLPKCRQNYTIGIKIVWTLSDEENWSATHRLAGKLWMAGGLLLLLCAFLPGAALSWVLPVVLGIMVIVPVVYSWRFSRRKEGETK